MNAWTLTLVSHVGPQLHNTSYHLLSGLVLALILTALGFPWKRAALLVLLYALLREFAYQLPFRDGWHWKLEDRLLDAVEWGLGALAAPLMAPLFAPVSARLRAAAHWLLAWLVRLVPASSHPATPAVRR